MALRAAFPSGPLVDDDGNLSAAWRGFFQSLYTRTGDAQGVSTGGLQTGLDAEQAARTAADTALSAAIVAERTARQGADAAITGAGDATKLPLTGGVLSGPLRGTTATFTTYFSNVGGPTWTSGTAAPTATAPVGSLYSCTGGALGARLYVSAGAGVWNAVAGV